MDIHHAAGSTLPTEHACQQNGLDSFSHLQAKPKPPIIIVLNVAPGFRPAKELIHLYRTLLGLLLG
jgi:hypothetical protein